MERLKQMIVNTLATTALALLILAGIALVSGGSVLFLYTIFQSLAVNILIHAGLPVVRLASSRYILIDVLLEIGYVLLVLILFGFIFGWYSSTPLWLVVSMGTAIYFVASAINVIRINKDVQVINAELKKFQNQGKDVTKN